MKIIHCADLHLDSKMTANLTKEKAKIRKAELLNTFINMVRFASENDVKVIIIAGDLYDTKNISVTAKNTVLDEMVKHAEIDFYYLRGNHDSESLLEGVQIPKNLKLFGENWISYVANHESGIQQRGSEIVITGIELTSENHNSIYDTLNLNPAQFNIVVLHGQESLHKAENDTWRISIRELKNKGIDYLALGHVHEYKKGTIDSRGMYCYPGCLEGRGFDECGEHGFVLLDIDEERKSFTTQLIPMAYRSLYTVEVDISDCMSTSDISDRIGNCLDGASYDKKSLLKIVLTGDTDIECEKNIELLQKEYEDDYFFLKVCDESGFKVDYEEFQFDESLKGEFVRNVMSENAITEEDKAKIIRYGIQLLMGEKEL
ncbi:MAG: metallophosphoesterase [Lachnospiraceae bacterium]|nr:metallophosphoesterase [Lachnospiraceae bacterium]